MIAGKSIAGIFGVAMVFAFVLVLSAGIGNGGPVYATPEETQTALASITPSVTPTATATPNNGCILTISKVADVDEAAVGEVVIYTITIENTTSGLCSNFEVSDPIPSDMDCDPDGVTAVVPAAWDEDDIEITGCDESGTVLFDFDDADTLGNGEEIVIQITFDVVDGEEDDDIVNTATVEATDVSVQGTEQASDSDTVTIVEAAATATNTPVATATGIPATNTPIPAAATPTVRATIAAPRTGSGLDSSGGPALLALALGLSGMAVLGGAAFAMKRNR